MSIKSLPEKKAKKFDRLKYRGTPNTSLLTETIVYNISESYTHPEHFQAFTTRPTDERTRNTLGHEE